MNPCKEKISLPRDCRPVRMEVFQEIEPVGEILVLPQDKIEHLPRPPGAPLDYFDFDCAPDLELIDPRKIKA